MFDDPENSAVVIFTRGNFAKLTAPQVQVYFGQGKHIAILGDGRATAQFDEDGLEPVADLRLEVDIHGESSFTFKDPTR